MAIALNSTLSHYISSVNSFAQLSREQEAELWRRWHEQGDPQAREALTRSTLRYSVSLALKYRGYGVPLSELVAEGNFGLVHALRKFDPKRGVRFLTYAAYWMRAYILEHIIRCWSLVGAGSGPLRSKLFFRLRRERARIHNLVCDREQANALLAAQFGISAEKLEGFIRRLEARDLSLDIRVADNSATSLLDTLASPACAQEQTVLERQERAHQRHIVLQALGALDERERFIVEKRLMCDREDELSQADIGRHFGVTRERIRQLEVRARQKLRSRISELNRPQEVSEADVESGVRVRQGGVVPATQGANPPGRGLYIGSRTGRSTRDGWSPATVRRS